MILQDRINSLFLQDKNVCLDLVCIVMELHRGGSATKGATPSSFSNANRKTNNANYPQPDIVIGLDGYSNLTLIVFFEP